MHTIYREASKSHIYSTRMHRGHDRLAFTRPLHQHLASLGCLLLVLAVWLPVPSYSSLARAAPAAEAILREGSGAALGYLGERFEDENLAKAQVVGDLEILTHAEETAAHTHADPDFGLPHGRQVRVRNGKQLTCLCGVGREGK